MACDLCKRDAELVSQRLCQSCYDMVDRVRGASARMDAEASAQTAAEAAGHPNERRATYKGLR